MPALRRDEPSDCPEGNSFAAAFRFSRIHIIHVANNLFSACGGAEGSSRVAGMSLPYDGTASKCGHEPSLRWGGV